jgi:hypothetical protein
MSLLLSAFLGKIQAIIQLRCLSVTKEKTLFFSARPNFLPLPSSPTRIVLSHWFPPLSQYCMTAEHVLWDLPWSPRSHITSSKWFHVEVCGSRSDIPVLFAVLSEYSTPSVMDSTPVSFFGDLGVHISAGRTGNPTGLSRLSSSPPDECCDSTVNQATFFQISIHLSSNHSRLYDLNNRKRR